MKVYLQAFVNFKQDNMVRFLPMATFAYNDPKIVNIGYMSFKLNCSYYPRVFFEKDVNPWSKLKLVDKLIIKLKKLITIYKKYLQYVYEFQKSYHTKYAKAKSYVPGEKVWWNSSSIKIKHNQKLKIMFFGPF